MQGRKLRYTFKTQQIPRKENYERMSRYIYIKNIYIYSFDHPICSKQKRKKKKRKKSDNRWKDSESMWQALQKIKMGRIKSPNKIKIAM